MSDDLERTLREHSPDVIAYRLSVLENEVNQVDRKLDSFISLYPSKELLDIMLEPLKATLHQMGESIKTLSVKMEERDASMAKKLEEREEQEEQERSNLKLVLIAAVAGPIMSVLVTLMIVGLQQGLIK